MLTTFLWGAAGTGFTFLMTTLGAATVFLFSAAPSRRFEKLMFGFAAGVMTAAAVWSLLLPAIEQTALISALPPWLPAAVGIVTGMGFLAGLDDLLPRLHRISDSNDGKWRQNALLIAAITLHNIPEGMAVGLAFALASDEPGRIAAAALALGIGIQNFPEGAAISLPLYQRGRSRGKAFLGGFLSGTVEPIFGLAVLLVAAGARIMMPWLLSFAAGAMVYVVVAELVPQAQGRSGTLGFASGFLLMMVLDVALG